MSVLLGDGESKRKWGNRFISRSDHSSWLSTATTCLLFVTNSVPQFSTTTQYHKQLSANYKIFQFRTTDDFLLTALLSFIYIYSFKLCLEALTYGQTTNMCWNTVQFTRKPIFTVIQLAQASKHFNYVHLCTFKNTSNFSDFLRKQEREFLWRAAQLTMQQVVQYLHDNNTGDQTVTQFTEKLNIENTILTIQEIQKI